MMQRSKRIRFERWQGNKARSEQQFMDTALLIETYLKKISWLQIKNDTSGNKQRSRQYEVIYNAYRLLRCVLLYCTLDLDEAIDLLDHRTLKALKNDFAALYDDYTNKPAERLARIQSNLEAFLQIKWDTFSKKQKAKELYYTLYFSLCSANQSMDNLFPGAGFLAGLYKIDIKKTHNIVKELIKQFEDNIMIFDKPEIAQDKSSVLEHKDVSLEPVSSPHDDLEVQISSPSALHVSQPELFVSQEPEETVADCTVPIQVSISASQKNIQNYFDERYLAILISESTVQEKLNSLLTLSNEIKYYIDQFNAERSDEEIVLFQRTQITTLLHAFQKNSTYILGRSYFLELQAAYRSEFNTLMLVTPLAKKEALLNNIEEQKTDETTTNALYVLSTALSPLIALKRAFLPTEMQRSLSSLVPQTLDAEAKILVKELAQDALDNIEDKLAAIKLRKEQTLAHLSAERPELGHFIAAESTASLSELASLNAVTQTYAELAAGLNQKADASVCLKAPIQDALQRRYADIMNVDGNEKGNIASLICTMRETVKGFTELMRFKMQQEELLLKIKPLHLLSALFHQQTTNKFVAPLAHESLRQLQAKSALLNKEIELVAKLLAQGDLALGDLLKAVSIESLRELITVNTISDSIDHLLLDLVSKAPSIEPSILGEPSLQKYFNERYSSLLNHDAYDEEARLTQLTHSMAIVDKNIKELIAVQDDYNALALQAKQIVDVLHTLERDNTNSCVIHLTKERLAFLNAKLARVQKRVDSIADVLADGSLPLKLQLVRTSSDALVNIIKNNQAATECVEQYRILKDKIALLNQMTNGLSSLDGYVATHYTWWVRLTDFLAQFLSLFKTHTGTMIDKAKGLKAEIMICKTQCEQEISAHIATIKKDEVIGSDLLGDLPEQHEYQAGTLSDAEMEVFDADKTLSLLASVSMFRVQSRQEENDDLNQDNEYDVNEPSFCTAP